MNRRFALSVLSVLLYAQGLLFFASVASVVIRHEQAPVVMALGVGDNAVR